MTKTEEWWAQMKDVPYRPPEELMWMVIWALVDDGAIGGRRMGMKREGDDGHKMVS